MPRMKKLGSQANPVRSSSWDGWEDWADNEILPMVPQILEKTPDTVVSQAGFWLFKILESVTAESGMIGMNASYLGKLFKRNTGTTFIEFLHMVRMDAACHLLATTDLQIVDIVSSVGFSDVPYFYKVFKKANGCTPITYRQQHQS